MMKRRGFLVVALALVLSLVLTACGGGSSSSSGGGEAAGGADGGASPASGGAQGSITINYSTWAADGEAAYEAMKLFKEIVEERSEGVITVNLFPSNQMGTTEEQLEQVSLNTLQMMSSGNPGSSKLEYLSLPYLFDNNAAFISFFESDLGRQFNQEIIDELGVYNISILARSPRIVSCNNEINIPEDFQGVKLRVPERDYYVKTFQAFGANPTPMDMGEIYSAIQTGVVSGQENPIETIVSYGFQNICDYLIITDHIVKPAFVAINYDFYMGLSDEHRAIVDDACEQARLYSDGALETEMENYYKVCEDAGMTIIRPDLAPFAAATQGVRDELGTSVWGEEAYQQILQLAGK